VAADLGAYREAQRRAWGDLEEAVIARYLAAEATEEERRRVEQAMRDFPRVRECVETLREVMPGIDLGREDRPESAGGEPSRRISEVPSKPHLYSPSSVRRLVPYALAACLLIAAGLAFLMPRNQLKRPPPDIPLASREKQAEATPQLIAMQVDQYRDVGDQRKLIGTIGVDRPSARERDLVRVLARLEPPAYCYVVAFTPNGDDKLYYPRDRHVPPPKSATIFDPFDPGFFPLAYGAGLQAFVLVASNDPLPSYERWRSSLREIPWQRTQADGVWRSDGGGLELAMADTPPSRSPERGGPTARSEPPRSLSQLCRFLTTRPGVAAVRALAFPVKPDRAEDTPPKSNQRAR
jgi:hypothetical protein